MDINGPFSIAFCLFTRGSRNANSKLLHPRPHRTSTWCSTAQLLGSSWGAEQRQCQDSTLRSQLLGTDISWRGEAQGPQVEPHFGRNGEKNVTEKIQGSDRTDVELGGNNLWTWMGFWMCCQSTLVLGMKPFKATRKQHFPAISAWNPKNGWAKHHLSGKTRESYSKGSSISTCFFYLRPSDGSPCGHGYRMVPSKNFKDP